MSFIVPSRPNTSPWGDFRNTWQLPDKITRDLANQLGSPPRGGSRWKRPVSLCGNLNSEVNILMFCEFHSQSVPEISLAYRKQLQTFVYKGHNIRLFITTVLHQAKYVTIIIIIRSTLKLNV